MGSKAHGPSVSIQIGELSSVGSGTCGQRAPLKGPLSTILRVQEVAVATGAIGPTGGREWRKGARFQPDSVPFCATRHLETERANLGKFARFRAHV